MRPAYVPRNQDLALAQRAAADDRAAQRELLLAQRKAFLQALQEALRAIPPGRSIVLYCGCCPWVDCPNVRPALQLAQDLGRHDVKLLHLPRNLQLDWIDQGLPISRGDQ